METMLATGQQDTLTVLLEFLKADGTRGVYLRILAMDLVVGRTVFCDETIQILAVEVCVCGQ